MRIEDFLALPGTLCIRLKVGPGLEDVIEISQMHYDTNKDELREFCLGLPDVEGRNWRTMKEFTGGNGTMAKLLIVLGDMVGAWKMYPDRELGAALWNRDHPRIVRSEAPAKRRVPKPSAGELEQGTKPCFCCSRPMGPPDSVVHDLIQAQEGSTLCLECEVMGCDGQVKGPCMMFPEKTAEEQGPRPVEDVEEEQAGPPAGLEAYLKQFQ